MKYTTAETSWLVCAGVSRGDAIYLTIVSERCGETKVHKQFCIEFSPTELRIPARPAARLPGIMTELGQDLLKRGAGQK